MLKGNIFEIKGTEFPAGRCTRVMLGENGCINGDYFCQGYVMVHPDGSVPEHDHATVESYCRDIGLNEIQRTDAGKLVETFPITPHCFRHSFATICYEAGLDPRQAAQILGDTPEVLEGVYTHLRDGRRQTAAEKLAAHFMEPASN